MNAKNFFSSGNSSEINSRLFSKALHEVKGDLFYAVLCLPVALTFQKLADGLIKPEASSISSMLPLLAQIIILAAILIVWVFELISISAVLFGLLRSSMTDLILAGTIFIVFMLAITVMGFVMKFRYLFEAAFMISMIAAFGGLYLFDKEEELDRSRYRIVLIGLLAIFPFVQPRVISLMQYLKIF